MEDLAKQIGVKTEIFRGKNGKTDRDNRAKILKRQGNLVTRHTNKRGLWFITYEPDPRMEIVNIQQTADGEIVTKLDRDWSWLIGEGTRAIKAQLLKLGFKFSGKRCAWYNKDGKTPEFK